MRDLDVLKDVFSRKWCIDVLLLLDHEDKGFIVMKEELGCTAKALVIALEIGMRHKLVCKNYNGYTLTERGKTLLRRLG